MSSDAELRAGRRDALAEKLVDSVSGYFNILTVYIGERLGLYDALAAGALTSGELAERTDTSERYVREWLEQQSMAGVLETDDAALDAEARRYSIPPGHDEVLVDRDSLDYLAPLARLAVGAASPLPAVLDAFRSGGGVPYADYGVDLREGQGAINRTTFLELLGREWLPAMKDVDARLRATPPARIADVGCGVGWSCIGMARSYPGAQVHGFDLDEPSVELARRHADEHGVGERVTFHVRDAAAPELAGRFDLVTAFECIHDLSDPVGVLRAMRGLMTDDGAALVVDERVADTFMGEGNDVEHIMYGWSVLHCLPAGMADQPSAATGTVMRTSTLERYAHEAGFERVEVLPVDNFFFRLYRLHA